MRRTDWFQRTFPAIADNGLLPGILERLAGTPARLRALVGEATPTQAHHGWSAAKELGHLADLEPLWLTRARDILSGRPELNVADLTNRATAAAHHYRWPV